MGHILSLWTVESKSHHHAQLSLHQETDYWIWHKVKDLVGVTELPLVEARRINPGSKCRMTDHSRSLTTNDTLGRVQPSCGELILTGILQKELSNHSRLKHRAESFLASSYSVATPFWSQFQVNNSLQTGLLDFIYYSSSKVSCPAFVSSPTPRSVIVFGVWMKNSIRPCFGFFNLLGDISPP